ncbi:MAG: hypothetical protein AMJ93_13005 [Anaerolineae bacterium SM23_84]|nr:MAG: hypothetical protein AMJ93_13005 [Anaerolineae bacterium SM23_84]
MHDSLRAQDIEEKIKHILVSRLEIEPSTVAACDSHAPLVGRGIGLDSVEALALIVGVEEAFDFEIPDEDLTVDLLSSISSLAEYVCQRLPSQTLPSQGDVAQ